MKTSGTNNKIKLYMKTTKVEGNFKDYLTNIKVYGKQMLSQDQIEYLDGGYEKEVYEFKQEDETDQEFYENFVKWLHEGNVNKGYVDYYLFLGLRHHEILTPWTFKNLESKVTECFEKGNGWLYEVNHRVRYKLTIRLIVSRQQGLHKLVRRSVADQDSYYRKQEKEIEYFVNKEDMFYSLYR